MKNLMKKLGKITLEGASGASYRFSVHPWERDFGAEGAVYVVTRRRSKPGGGHEHRRIFAGETANLSGSVAGHRKSIPLHERDANCICVHAEASEARRR